MTTPIPAQGAGRIRWAEDPVLHVWSGHVGTLAAQLFAIAAPLLETQGYLLMSRLPGMDFSCSRPALEEAQAEAERWLEEFVSSLGASFPAGPVISRCECGGLASHRHGCRWRQGYGSLIESVLEECQP
jgi:hypothetical protein